MNFSILTLPFLYLISVALGIGLFSVVSGQQIRRNPNSFSAPQKSIRGFYFKNYYDYVKDAFKKPPVNNEGKKKVELKGEKNTWILELTVNTNLFSPSYQHYGENFQPQPSNLRDCHYHVLITFFHLSQYFPL
ncbi:hypothetical protein HMI54_005120 [Coelomomyces lativittatus]|nr:hypothetical protein HMI54_005120 [Coelomomyces lativittatus]KAJ1506511.1 hypothetical protein HMI56_000579 [Coelomomyces lativittatus]